MNVLVVGHTYISAINRDKWKALAALYPHSNITVVIPKRWPATLFNHIIDPVALNKENTPNLTFIALDTFFQGSEVRYLYYPRQLYHVIKTSQPDIIHTEQGDGALSYTQCIVTARLLGLRPKFVFFTWINWSAAPSRLHRIFWHPIQRYNLTRSHGALTGNSQARDLLEKKGCSKPITVLAQLGVNQKVFYPLNEQKINLETKTITFVGRLVPEKGVFLLLEAFTRLQEYHASWQLNFIGDGPAKDQLCQTIKEVNNLQIKHCTPCTHHEVADKLRTTDIFVLPSYDTATWKEQFGHVIIEAMACGIPVIASTGGAIPEVVGNAGIICKQNDINDLTQCLRLFMHDEKIRKNYAKKGIALVSERYTHEAIADSTYRFWHKMLSST